LKSPKALNDWGVHVEPPFVVLSNTPMVPITVPLFISEKLTPIKVFVAPLDCGIHVVPRQ